MPTNKQRAAILNRLKQRYNVRRLARESKAGLKATADVMLKLERISQQELFGGNPRFTGNNRVYRNGAIGFEVACKHCAGRFWVTRFPYALCPDCDHIQCFR